MNNNIIFDNIIALTGAGISKASGIPTFSEHPEIKNKLSAEYKNKNTVDFKTTINKLITTVLDKEPNDAHKALAEYNIPVITMNIDMLHQKAGSKKVLELHGNIEDKNIVLYGEQIHNYNEVFDLIESIPKNQKNCLMVIGTSLQTVFAKHIVNCLTFDNFYIERINSDAEHNVRKFLELHYKRKEGI